VPRRFVRTRPTVVALVAALVTAVVFTSCGSSSGGNPSGGSAGAPQACSLVSPSDIQAALGAAPLTPPKSDTQTQCEYASATEGNYVNVQVEGGQTTASFEKASSSAGPTQRITGLGDEAFQNMGGGTVFVLKGSTSVRIDVFLTTVSPSAVQSLAQTAIGGL
jgi:hypothetical protein